jgi:farnesyl diphosphate synthase
MKKIEDRLSSFKQWLEPIISKKINLLPENDDAQKRMKSAIKYSLLGNAKRVRAFIIEQSCLHYGIPKEDIVNLMVAVEYIHCYSLIHDDLPCMDNSDERRGKPSLHKNFDEATALLTGNSLVTLALDEIFSDDFSFENYVKVHLVKNLSKAIGFYGMMAGQMLDLLVVNSQTAKTEEFIHMNKLKTGELFAFCMSSGAIITQSIQNIAEMQQIGYDIGYIFQLVDDILDVQDDTQLGLDAKKTFIEHIGGTDEAQRHLFMIAEQAKVRVRKACNNVYLVDLIDYITNQLKA